MSVTNAAPALARPSVIPRADRTLRWTAGAFAVASVLHNGDHFRRGVDSVTPQLNAAGYAAMAVSLAAVVMVLTRQRLAPLVAAASGFPLAAGFAAAHWLPSWGPLSDPFLDAGTNPFSRAASLLEIAGALALGVAGVRAMRRAQSVDSAGGDQSERGMLMR